MSWKLRITCILLLVFSCKLGHSQIDRYYFNKPCYKNGLKKTGKYLGLSFDLFYDSERPNRNQNVPEFLVSLRHVKIKENGFGVGVVARGGVFDDQPGIVSTNKHFLVSMGSVLEKELWREASLNPYITMHSSLGYSWKSLSSGQISGLLEPGAGLNLLMAENFQLGFEVRTLLDIEIYTFSESYTSPEIFRGLLLGMTLKFGDTQLCCDEKKRK